MIQLTLAGVTPNGTAQSCSAILLTSFLFLHYFLSFFTPINGCLNKFWICRHLPRICHKGALLSSYSKTTLLYKIIQFCTVLSRSFAERTGCQPNTLVKSRIVFRIKLLDLAPSWVSKSVGYSRHLCRFPVLPFLCARHGRRCSTHLNPYTLDPKSDSFYMKEIGTLLCSFECKT